MMPFHEERRREFIIFLFFFVKIGFLVLPRGHSNSSAPCEFANPAKRLRTIVTVVVHRAIVDIPGSFDIRNLGFMI